MRIFQSLFGSPKEVNTRNEIEVVPEKVCSMTTQILLLMEQYIQENSSKLALPDSADAYDSLLLEYNKLSKIGLQNTKNAKIIKEKLDSITAIYDTKNKAEELFKFIKSLRKHFGENTLLISSEQFHNILSKYNLKVGIIDQYTGIIPDKNIKEIENVTKKLSTSPFRLNTFNEPGKIFLVDEIKYSSDSRDDIGRSLEKWLAQKTNLVWAGITARGTVFLKDLKVYNLDLPNQVKTYPYNYLVAFEGSFTTSNTLFIACPPSQLKEQSLRITEKAIDPIVFQYSPYGIVVHSIWGEEAEDKIFEEYRRVNNLLSI